MHESFILPSLNNTSMTNYCISIALSQSRSRLHGHINMFGIEIASIFVTWMMVMFTYLRLHIMCDRN